MRSAAIETAGGELGVYGKGSPACREDDETASPATASTVPAATARKAGLFRKGLFAFIGLFSQNHCRLRRPEWLWAAGLRSVKRRTHWVEFRPRHGVSSRLGHRVP